VVIGSAAAALVVAVLLSARWPDIEFGAGVNVAAIRRHKAPAKTPTVEPGAPEAPKQPDEAQPKPAQLEPGKEPPPAKPEPPAPALGTVIVSTIPGVAKVLLDDKEWGTTPASGNLSEKVPAGVHKLRIEKEGFQPEEKSIAVEDGRTLELQMALVSLPKPEEPKPPPEPPKAPITEVTLALKCNLEGATVWVNDKESGKTPRAGQELKLTLKPGEYAFRVRKSGYVSWGKKVTLGSSKEATETAQLSPLPAEISNDKDGASMALVPAGEFIMGSDEGSEQAKPKHVVYLSAFYVDRYEVTNAQFREFIRQTQYRPESRISWERYAGTGREDFPVRGVTWNDAAAYAKWAGKRLPTEAEWEKAARGPSGQRFPWGNDYDQTRFHGNVALEDGPMRVGSFPGGRSPYGCEDMAGNVWEWCSDWYDADYYAKSPKENPTGPSRPGVRKAKVIRGGAWDRQSIEHIKGYERNHGAAASPETVGFRCVKDVAE
jgi:formylglycine-generating enzyme required for sulfatase activity